MFNTISWQAYWMAIALISAGYYLIIILIYFRKDLKLSAASNTSSFLHSSQKTEDHWSSAASHASDFAEPEKGTDEHMVYACIDEINAFIQEAKRVKTGKEDFLLSIKVILAKYPTIKKTEYKEAVTSVLISEAAHHCSIHLSEAEVDSVWLD
jgi:hypothetical protein